jgi:response regulator RpfG family c-di-GMP phosphodiesterase/serine/threonine protein kinase
MNPSTADAAVSNPLLDGTLALPPPARLFLEKLQNLALLEPDAVRRFVAERVERLADYRDAERLGHALVQAGLVTDYQLDRVRAGKSYGLVLGSYRVLETLGAGGMGMVFLAEHRLLRRRVAVKVLPLDEDCPPELRQRFYAEMRVLAELQHPNIVLAYDAGEITPPQPNLPPLLYLVMELVDGGDLDGLIRKQKSLPLGRACDFIRQAALGLQAAHDRHLIHRDLKPSNLLLARGGQIKVVDFGLARQFCSRLTDPRSLLGSVDFMPPEQSHDPSNVGKEADVYGLGATLFFLLTGEGPYPPQRSVGAALRALKYDLPRRLRDLRPEIPAPLDELTEQMLHRDLARRPASPLAVANALAPFVGSRTVPPPPLRRPAEPGVTAPPKRRVLIVDDQAPIRKLLRVCIEPCSCACVEASDGGAALAAAAAEVFDLVLLDLNLPDVDGYEICRLLRQRAPNPYLKIIVISGRCGDDLADSLPRGADDFLAKPFQSKQVAAKVRQALQLQESQEKAGRTAESLLHSNRELQRSLEARAQDVRQAHDALLFAMAKMAESRDGETHGHLRRLQGYTRALATAAAQLPPWLGLVDERFLEQLARCVPLHDIGKIGLPEEVLLKPGALTEAERRLVETHPLIGDRILEALGKEHGAALDFLGTARGIVRGHHERWDGSGYPDCLAADAIPAAARLTAIADVYDALRRDRFHKPAMSHADAVDVLLQQSPGQFDPSLLRAFANCHGAFERIFRDRGD